MLNLSRPCWVDVACVFELRCNKFPIQVIMFPTFLSSFLFFFMQTYLLSLSWGEFWWTWRLTQKFWNSCKSPCLNDMCTEKKVQWQIAKVIANQFHIIFLLNMVEPCSSTLILLVAITVYIQSVYLQNVIPWSPYLISLSPFLIAIVNKEHIKFTWVINGYNSATWPPTVNIWIQ